MTDFITAIVEQASEQTGKEMGELPPLHDAVDVDGLLAIIDDVSRIEFEYAGCTVVIQDGNVNLHQ